MATLNYNEITEKKTIIVDDEPWEVVSSHVFRKQQRKPVNATKIKNLITGRVTERSFHQSEKVEVADIESKDINFIYSNKGEHWFHEKGEPSSRFSIKENVVGPHVKFLKSGEVIKAILFHPSSSSGQGKIIGVKLPIKVDLKVTEAAPAVKGNTAQGALKQVKLENQTLINVPLFINEGDIVRINTDTGEYTERISR